MNGTEILEAFKAGNLHEAEEKVFETYNRLAALVIEGTKQQIAQGYLGETEHKLAKEETEKLDETAYDSKLDSKKKVTVTGVMGAKSKSFKKSFPNMKAFEKWSDSEEAGNYEVHHVVNEDALNELSKDTLGSYIGKATAAKGHHMSASKSSLVNAQHFLKRSKDYNPRSFMARDNEDRGYKALANSDDEATRLNNRKKGIQIAAKKLAREDAEQIDELDRQAGGILDRYSSKIRRMKDGGERLSPKRKEGAELAGKKRWGDKKYGLPEPKVKGVERS